MYGMPARPVSGTTYTGHSHSRLDHASALANRNAKNTPYVTVIDRHLYRRLRPDSPQRRMLRVDAGVDRLTQVLAGRLAAIVPEGFQVEASDGILWYSADHGRFPGQRGERPVRAAAQALSELQDYVDEATHEPWPGKRTPPQAYAEIRDAVLRLWFGEAGAASGVVLGCDPIPLADIGPGG